MTPEEIWRRKTDEELLAASTRLVEYTEQGQHVILDEIRRRELAATAVASMNQAESDDVGLAAVSAEAARKSEPYVVRLWRGQVSLPVTYWVWGFLGNALTRLLILVLILVSNRSIVLGFAILLFYLAYCVFIVVAIWRSAARYTGPRIWRDLARFSLVLLGIIWVVDRFLVLTD